MDYLDPKKQRQHTILLIIGYICIGVAIIIATFVLVYQANGYVVNGDGTVIQNGLVFFSSQPHPAQIYVDNKLAKVRTNARDTLPAGIYKIRISRTGYQNWQRTIEVDGR
jgi:K+-transporting ATPase c subunit